jgi:hypothetical protein
MVLRMLWHMGNLAIAYYRASLAWIRAAHAGSSRR